MRNRISFNVAASLDNALRSCAQFAQYRLRRVTESYAKTDPVWLFDRARLEEMSAGGGARYLDVGEFMEYLDIQEQMAAVEEVVSPVYTLESFAGSVAYARPFTDLAARTKRVMERMSRGFAQDDLIAADVLIAAQVGRILEAFAADSIWGYGDDILEDEVVVEARGHAVALLAYQEAWASGDCEPNDEQREAVRVAFVWLSENLEKLWL